ncbi:MAG: glycosyltransferase [Alphaproteobacteria bacterium]|nr:glycosyltransferase [Alphaproteobacteria bacterium]
MKILLVGNGNFKHRGARYYDQTNKLANGLIRCGHNVYFLSDRDTARAVMFGSKSIFGTQARAARHCSRVFLQICRNFKPDLIMCVHADLLTADALLAAREILPQVKIAQFNVDIIFNEHNAKNITDKLPGVDATFITTAGPGLKKFSRPGKRVSYVPNIIDSSIEWPRSFERSDQKHDVFWALRALRGSAPGDRRIEYPLYLETNGVDIDYYGMNGKPLLYDARYYEAIAGAKMGVNISQIWTKGNYEKAADEDLYLYSSDRISHYLGGGLLTFITRDHKLEELFPEDKEAVYFGSKEELLDKVRYYREHDEARKTIARAGWEKAHTHYNERLIGDYLVEATFGRPFSHPYLWPTQGW